MTYNSPCVLGHPGPPPKKAHLNYRDGRWWYNYKEHSKSFGTLEELHEYVEDLYVSFMIL